MRTGTLLLVLSVLAAVALTLLARGTSSPSADDVFRAEGEESPAANRAAGPTLEGAPEAEAAADGADDEGFDLGGFETMEDFLAFHRPRRIHGRVVDAHGKEVRGSVVWIDPAPGGWRPTAMADAQGRFTLTLQLPNTMPGGTYSVAARGPEGGVAMLEVGVGDAGEEIQIGDLVLEEGGVIQGRVVNEAGEGLEEIRVRAYDEEGAILEMFEQGRRVLIGTDDVLTDVNGRFALRGLLPHPHWIRVELMLRPGQRVEPEELRGVHPDGEEIRFRLFARARVGGQVFDARTNEPISSFALGGLPFRDAQGRFRTDLPANGHLHVSARGYVARDVRDLHLREGDTLPDVRVGLDPDPEVGTLVVVGRNPEGEPVGGFAVRGTGADFVLWEEPASDVATSELRVEGLKPGAHTFWVTGEGLGSARGRATIEIGSEHRVEVVLARGGAISLHVLDVLGDVARDVGFEVLDAEGRPVPYHFAYAKPQGTLLRVTEVMGPQRQQLTAAEGRLYGLPEGSYTLRLHGPGDRTTQRDVGIDIPPSGVVEKTIRLSGEEPSR